MTLLSEPCDDGITIVRMDGRLDLVTAAQVKQQLTELVASGHRRLIFDLDRVSFVDSSGLGALISGLKVARQAGGDLRIARANQQVRTLLNLTMLERVLRPYETLEEARAGYSQIVAD
ncbi:MULTISPECIES: STAS domain-containing protein [Roseiflexus]|uniref:Anti-sigma factor antagonist n=1 Tax=Roseiflexus castenholzii (strain DSM 13941 / HLO8) TaxID=383372 RepID=A7NIB6_ROSCS|nr:MULTISPECIES: STAS domain-containing protein [Roseiflexus]ABU57216.1 anti-sigma-factor antagonist [Roseiflexus castenholzii DSM 13941]GIW00059.1 MAG: anti-sigma factor antagonist [Roseiflexus sp.]